MSQKKITSSYKKKSKIKIMPGLRKFKKKKKKKEKRKKERKKRQRYYPKIKKKAIGADTHGHFCQSRKNASPISFLPVLGRKHFERPREKTSGLHHLFSFLPTQPNLLQKKFSFLFSFHSFPFIMFHLQTNTL